MIRHGLHTDLAQDTQTVPGKMLLPPILELGARTLPEAQPAGLQCVAEEALVCRHHRGDVVEHGDGLNNLLRGLKGIVLQVALIEFCGEVWSLRERRKSWRFCRTFIGMRHLAHLRSSKAKTQPFQSFMSLRVSKSAYGAHMALMYAMSSLFHLRAVSESMARALLGH